MLHFQKLPAISQFILNHRAHHSTPEFSNLIGQNMLMTFNTSSNSSSDFKANYKFILIYLLEYVVVSIVTTNSQGLVIFCESVNIQTVFTSLKLVKGRPSWTARIVIFFPLVVLCKVWPPWPRPQMFEGITVV